MWDITFSLLCTVTSGSSVVVITLMWFPFVRQSVKIQCSAVSNKPTLAGGQWDTIKRKRINRQLQVFNLDTKILMNKFPEECELNFCFKFLYTVQRREEYFLITTESVNDYAVDTLNTSSWWSNWRNWNLVFTFESLSIIMWTHDKYLTSA